MNNFSNILFTKTQQQILCILFGHVDKDFYTNEIIRLSKCGHGAVQRELLKLTIAGLIIVKQVGNQKHYQANKENPLFKELRTIVIKTFGLADFIREAINPLSNQIDFAFIYGSIAKQDDTATSDVDLMIITDKLTYIDLFKVLEPIELKIYRKINPTIYSTEEWKRKLKKENNFVHQVKEQPKIFLIGMENEFTKLG